MSGFLRGGRLVVWGFILCSTFWKRYQIKARFYYEPARSCGLLNWKSQFRWEKKTARPFPITNDKALPHFHAWCACLNLTQQLLQAVKLNRKPSKVQFNPPLHLFRKKYLNTSFSEFWQTTNKCKRKSYSCKSNVEVNVRVSASVRSLRLFSIRVPASPWVCHACHRLTVPSSSCRHSVRSPGV